MGVKRRDGRFSCAGLGEREEQCVERNISCLLTCFCVWWRNQTHLFLDFFFDPIHCYNRLTMWNKLGAGCYFQTEDLVVCACSSHSSQVNTRLVNCRCFELSTSKGRMSDMGESKSGLGEAGLATNSSFSVSFLWKIIHLPGGQINDPTSRKYLSLSFLPAAPSFLSGTL